jgi:acyl-CoA dehydrogenase
VFPSRLESAGLVLLEAMSYGVPGLMIRSDNVEYQSAAPDFVVPGTGFVAKDAAEFAAILRRLIMNPTETRERLCRGVYRTVEPGNPLGLLSEALSLSLLAEPVEKRIRVDGVKTGKVTALDLPGQIKQALAAGIIKDHEAELMTEYDRKVMNLINVDDFDPQELASQAEPAAPRGSMHVA